jgi:hypothetical protein
MLGHTDEEYDRGHEGREAVANVDEEPERLAVGVRWVEY